jgi:DNA-binding PadR family transcriptional regulator
MEREGFLKSQKQQQGGRTRRTYSVTEMGKEYIKAYIIILKEQMADTK